MDTGSGPPLIEPQLGDVSLRVTTTHIDIQQRVTSLPEEHWKDIHILPMATHKAPGPHGHVLGWDHRLFVARVLNLIPGTFESASASTSHCESSLTHGAR